MTADELKARIREAFADVEFPGDWCLRGSNEGDEPFLLEDEFKGKTDRYALPAKFLDQAPDGFSSALCFFSDEAFRFYLPAYMIADIDNALECTEPAWHLCHGLDEGKQHEKINPTRYGDRTVWDDAVHKFAIFNTSQCAAIIEYLKFVRNRGENLWMINQALQNYWSLRTEPTRNRANSR